MGAWYCFSTEPQREVASSLLLQRAGYRTAVPCEVKYVRKSRYGRRKPRQIPILTSYILIHFDDEPVVWPLFNRFKFLKRVVTVDGRPAPITEAVLATLEERQSKNHRRSFGVGDNVTVFGDYSGCEGRIEEISGDLARLDLPLLGAKRRVAVPLDWLEAV